MNQNVACILCFCEPVKKLINKWPFVVALKPTGENCNSMKDKSSRCSPN